MSRAGLLTAARSLAAALAVPLVASLALALAGCDSGAAPAASPSPSPSAASAPSASPSSAPPPPLTAAHRRKLARLYLAVAGPANKALDHEVDTFEDARHDDLPTAIAALRGQARVERSFDTKLAAIGFPRPLDATAYLLIQVNQERIKLTLQEAKATSLAGLAAFRQRHRAADAAVERQVRVIRKQLGLPPPETG
jgi:hypothetical protein